MNQPTYSKPKEQQAEGFGRLILEFEHPSAEFSPMPFWFWNDTLTEEEIELVERYIHGLFPRLGIRFVSIVDNADTANKGNKKSRQINGLVNEWYLEDMFASIDAAVGTIEGQIRKNKTRLARRLRQDAFARTAEETSFVSEEKEDDLSIVRIKKFNFRPMSREEAVLQMNLLEHNFFAFRDEDNHGAFAVVYRRNDGGFGLIEDGE